MARLLSNHKITDALTIAALLAAIASLIAYPADAVEAAKNGLELCANVIIPSLFPFFVLSSICVELGLIRFLGKLLEPVMKPLFRVSGACSAAFALGIIGGYPVGAKTAISLYEKNYCTKDEAERLLAFCNNSGPAFILGVVGAGIFSSSTVGIMLYLIHIFASVIVGVLFRFYGKKPTSSKTSNRQPIKAVRFTSAFTESVKEAFSSTLNICAFVIFFTVIIRVLFLSGAMSLAATVVGALLAPIGMTEQWAEKLLIGLIEMSSGVWSLQSASGTLTGKLAMAAFILGWAGVSVHCQVLSFIGSSGLSTRPYLLGKLLHGMVSAALVSMACKLLPVNFSVSEYYAEQVAAIATTNFSTAFYTSVSLAAVAFVILTLISAVIIKKTAGKNARHIV